MLRKKRKRNPNQNHIPTADILKESEKTTTTLQKMSTSLIPQDKILGIEEKFPEFLKIVEDFKKDPDMLNLEKLSTSKLSDLQKKWMSHLTTVKGWEDNLVARSEKLEKDRINLLETRRTWDVTYIAAEKEKVPNQMLIRIKELTTTISEIQTKYRKRLDEKISLQNIVSEKVILINTTITQIDELLIQKKQQIFSIDSNSLWEAFKAEEGRTGFFLNIYLRI